MERRDPAIPDIDESRERLLNLFHQARREVQPLVDKERAGEIVTGEIMHFRFR